MGVSKYRITLIEEEKELLKVISRKHKESQNIVRRAKIILRANEGVQRQAIAAELDINEHQVTAWIKRWLGRSEDRVIERLQDLPRPGAPGSITPEQWCQIVAMSCEKPAEYGLPITDWSHRELANELVKQGVVDAISPSHLGRMLKKRPPAAPNPVLAERQAGRTQGRETPRDL